MKRMYLIIFVFSLVALAFVGYFLKNSKPKKVITSFEECVENGNPMMESNPPQCRTADGKIFTAPINSAENAPPGSIHNLPVPEAVARVKKEVSRLENVDEGKIVVLEAVETEWPDACLGLPEEDQMCAQAIISGYSVKATANGKEFVFRTNSEGTVLKQEDKQ